MANWTERGEGTARFEKCVAQGNGRVLAGVYVRLQKLLDTPVSKVRFFWGTKITSIFLWLKLFFYTNIWLKYMFGPYKYSYNLFRHL